MRKNISLGQWMLHGIFAPIENKNIRWVCTVAGVALSIAMMVQAERKSAICLHRVSQ